MDGLRVDFIELKALFYKTPEVTCGHAEEPQMPGCSSASKLEVLALQAIYGDDMVILEDKAGLRSFQIFVWYPIPNGTKVFLNLHPNGTMVGTDNDGNQDGSELFYACSLKHLPPVVLTCLLPCSYPSTSAPYFTISAKWLDEPKVSHLCAMFDEIWTELPGQEVVYRWLDWLSSSSWACISLNDNIILVPDKTSDVGDERAIARRLLVDSTIPLMQSYNGRRSHEIFLKRQKFHQAPMPPFVLLDMYEVSLQNSRNRREFNPVDMP
ncbi:unnamed protein product [Miscanthus lutarioriparius]|uniref:RWD domain-containing protein n=1 Tax=Miscanthus lutarioriparius TaxID=422564 RepID=A0A811PTN4_9POAL|nr:unnamed protein product [Miscanthus lutarioriparius]